MVVEKSQGIYGENLEIIIIAVNYAKNVLNGMEFESDIIINLYIF